MILGGGVLLSVGDGKGVIIGDVVGVFLVGLLFVIGLGLYMLLGVWGVLFVCVVDEFVKVLIFEWCCCWIDWVWLVEE